MPKISLEKIRGYSKKNIDVIAFLVFLVLIIAFRFYILVYITGSNVPVAVVDGYSMFPLLKEGDIVFSYKPSPDEIRPGDIIIYNVGGRYIIHRVVEVIKRGKQYYYLTRGDNNEAPDFYYQPGVPYNKVEGKVVAIGNLTFKIPYLGYYSLWFHKIQKIFSG